MIASSNVPLDFELKTTYLDCFCIIADGGIDYYYKSYLYFDKLSFICWIRALYLDDLDGGITFLEVGTVGLICLDTVDVGLTAEFLLEDWLFCYFYGFFIL